MVGSGLLRLRNGAVIGLTIVLAGCGTAAHKTQPRRPEKSVTPREIEHTFREVERAFPPLHFRMFNTGVYTSRDIPIIRKFAFDFGPGNKHTLNQYSGTLYVYGTVKEAAADQSVEPSPSIIRRANLIAVFAPGTPGIVRRIITAALNAATTGSARVNGHSLTA